MPKKATFITVFIGWIVLITVLSLFDFSPDDGMGIKIPYLDKLAHFTFYFVFVLLGWLMVKHGKPESRSVEFPWLLILFAIGYGLLMELLQHLFPVDRSAEFSDVLANTLGALMGGLLVKKYLSRTQAVK